MRYVLKAIDYTRDGYASVVKVLVRRAISPRAGANRTTRPNGWPASLAITTSPTRIGGDRAESAVM
jgi:hypothetical protein